MSYELIYKDYGFELSFKGNVTIEEMNKAYGKIQGHREFDGHCFQIIDLLDADLSSITVEDTKMPAYTNAIASKTRWNVKVALIVCNKTTLNVVDGYLGYARPLVPKWKFCVFSTYKDALDWVKS